MLPESIEDGGIVTLRLLLPSRDIGAIIGRKGATINSIREESEAKIKISSSDQDTGTYYREIILSGTIGQTVAASYLIASRLEENSSEQGEDVRLEILFPNSITGAVIGTKGETIKELRTKTNTQILISHEVLFGSTDRSICVSGASTDIRECVRYLAAILHENPAKGNHVPFRVNSHIQMQRAGRIIHQGAGNPPRRSMSSGAFTKGAATQSSTDTMTVQKELIGCVIGKNGIKIRQIRDLSQAQIRISSPGDDPSRTITISGTPDAVSTAKYLINYQINNELKKSP